MAITFLDNQEPNGVVTGGNPEIPVSGINNLKDPYDGKSLLQRNLIQDDIKLKEDVLKWRQDTRRQGDYNSLNFDEFLPDVPAEERKRSLIRGVMDSEMDINPSSVTSYETARAMVDKALFSGDGNTSDDALFLKIQNRAKETKETEDFYDELSQHAAVSSILGGQQIETEFGQKALENPVYQREKHEAVSKWKDVKDEVNERFGNIIPEVRSLWKMIDQDEIDLYKISDIVDGLDDDELGDAALLLGKLQEVKGQSESGRGFFGNALEQSGRDKERTGSGLKGAGVEFFSKVVEGLFMMEEDRAGGDYSKEIEGERGRQKNLERTERFMSEIRRARDQRDPILKKAKEGSFLSHAENAFYAIPGVGMTIAASATPLVGQANTVTMLLQSARDSYYLRAVDDLGDRGEARSLANEVSLPIVALQYLPERFGLAGVTRKLPMLNKFLDKLPNFMQGKTSRILAGTISRGATESVTEEIQAVLTEVGNDMLNTLNEEIQGSDWDTHWANFGGRNLETFLSMVPYSALPAVRHDSGMGKAVQTAGRATRDQLLAAGYKPADVDEFQNSQGDLAKRTSLGKMLTGQDPSTEETKSAVKRVIEHQEKTKKSYEDLVKRGSLPGVRVSKDQDGFEIYDAKTGETTLMVKTEAEAAAAVFEAIGVRDQVTKDNVDVLISKIQAARLIADDTGVTQEIEDTKLLTTEEAGRIFKGSDERIAEEVELLESAEGGSGGVARAVFDTVTAINIPAGTHGRIEEVTKTYRGSSIFTLIHEKAHSVRRELMAKEEITNDEQILFFRKLNEVLKGKVTRKTKDGRETELQFEGFDGDTVTETAIDEAWAQFSEIMLLKSQNGKKSKMRELLNTNLSAMVRSNIPGASKFKAFIRAMREWLGLNLTRAAVLNKAERDGKLDAAEMEKFRAMVMGETSQDQYEDEVVDTYKETFEGKGEASYSISKSSSLRMKMTRKQIIEAVEGSSDWKDFYDRHEELLNDYFGPDAALFQRILSATSQAASVKSNVSLALRAYGMIKRGEDLAAGWIDKGTQKNFLPLKNLQKIVNDEEKLSGRKIGNYEAASTGDTSKVVVDRHVARMLFGVLSPTKKQFEKAEKVLTEVAATIGWSPREAQAAI